MNPIYIALAGVVGGLLIFSERKSEAPPPQIQGGPNPYLPPQPTYGALNSRGAIYSTPASAPATEALTESNIMAAYHVALTTEKSASNLRQFGTALTVMGYGKEGASLIKKASHPSVTKVDSTSQLKAGLGSIFGGVTPTHASSSKPKTAKPKPKAATKPKAKTEKHDGK